LKLDEIAAKLQKIKSNIETAFEKELIDFDEIENELSSIIDSLEARGRTVTSAGKAAIKTENYV
jgi:transcriptional regulator NrdR family protein